MRQSEMVPGGDCRDNLFSFDMLFCLGPCGCHWDIMLMYRPVDVLPIGELSKHLNFNLDVRVEAKESVRLDAVHSLPVGRLVIGDVGVFLSIF